MATKTRDALTALANLSPETIRERLRELDSEARTLRTLLRAVQRGNGPSHSAIAESRRTRHVEATP